MREVPSATSPILPGRTIGVLGGGQLGRMMALEARRMGYRVVALDPDPMCPCAGVVNTLILGALDDVDAGRRLAEQCEVLTMDTEHVPADTLDLLSEHVLIRPDPAIYRIIQDRQTQKRFLDSLGLPVATWAPANTPAERAAALVITGPDAVLKTRRSGYDGKGQARIRPGDDVEEAAARIGHQPAVLEAFVPFERELSVLLARGVTGELRIWPIAENAHRDHILHTTVMPARIPPTVAARAAEIARALAEGLDLVGVMAVELFHLGGDTLLVNEIAPRTHNSGHATWGACATSQFAQQVRAVCGLPLGDPSLLRPGVMLNLLGDLWGRGAPDWRLVLDHSNADLHLYGKMKARTGRKMGHALFLHEDVHAALAQAEAVHGALSAAAS